MADIIDGKAFAAGLQERITAAVSRLKADHEVTPGLAVIIVGDDPASAIYVRNKGKRTRDVGMNSFEHKLPAETSEADLLTLIERLNNDAAVHGILCQLPLPEHLDEDLVINSIALEKDVDGFHIQNVGLLKTGQEALVPCTALGCLMLAKDRLGDLSGLEAVVVGRSNIVGKPMADLLLAENCTVTTAHSRTRNLAEHCRRADILVAAVGRAELIKGDWIKPGALVLDVGVNRIPVEGGKDRLLGDVEFDVASKIAGSISPVPGGVGPMTIACLLVNTVTACCRVNGLDVPEGLGV